MDSPIAIRSLQNQPEPALSPPGSTRRLSIGSEANSPEFEFWRVRNPTQQVPPPTLLSADELFSDGFLLPLHLVPPLQQLDPDPDSLDPCRGLEPRRGSGSDVDSWLGADATSEPKSIAELTSEARLGPGLTSGSSAPSSSKRWKDIFRKSEKKSEEEKPEGEKKKKKKKKQQGREKGQPGSSSASAELNINLWPFSRSRSAGNSVSRPRMSFGAPAARKSSSAPCSRSNSAGESKSRKWPSSPGRAGVHVGRSSPVWQVRRGGGRAPPDPPAVKPEEKAKAGLNLNVPMCIGYRTRLSCRSHETSVVRGSGRGGSNSDGGNSNFGGNSGHNLFGLRSLFAKKAY